MVLEGMNPREALESAYEDINRELRRKQQEFGFAPPEAPTFAVSPEIDRLIQGRTR